MSPYGVKRRLRGRAIEYDPHVCGSLTTGKREASTSDPNPRHPPDPSDDIDFLGRALVDEVQAVEQYEDAGWRLARCGSLPSRSSDGGGHSLSIYRRRHLSHPGGRSRSPPDQRDERTRHVKSCVNPGIAPQPLADDTRVKRPGIRHSREPPDPPDDVDLLGRALVRRIDRVVGDDPHRRRIAVGDVFQPLGDEAEPVEQHENAGRRRRGGAVALDAIKRLTPATPSVSTTCVLSASPSPRSPSPSSARR